MTDPIIEAMARAGFAAMEGYSHSTSWDFGQGPENVSDEYKQRFRGMMQAAYLAALPMIAEEWAKVADSWGERSTTPGEKTIWHAIGASVGDDIRAHAAAKVEEMKGG